ncbi:hypothetical protein [Virgisporangium aurantiacum]|nr:hypothetical protein [Virgisporangium aurantiacum]
MAGDEYVVVTGPRRWWHWFVTVPAHVFAGAYVLHVAPYGFVVLAAGVGGLWLLAPLLRRLRGNSGRWRGRGRGRPAMRFTAAGLDFNPVFDGTFPIHVPWTQAQSTFHRGSGRRLVWCVHSPQVEGLGLLRGFLPAAGEHLEPEELRAAVTKWADDRPGPGDPAAEVLLANAAEFGTFIAIDAGRAEGVDLKDLEERLAEWSRNRCTLEPDTAPRRHWFATDW